MGCTSHHYSRHADRAHRSPTSCRLINLPLVSLLSLFLSFSFFFDPLFLFFSLTFFFGCCSLSLFDALWPTLYLASLRSHRPSSLRISATREHLKGHLNSNSTVRIAHQLLSR